MTQKISKAHLVFSDYISFVSPQVIMTHGISYMDTTASRNKWRSEIPYSQETEQFLIMKTKLFISTLDSQDSTSTNPLFLKSLINLIADYLSAYVVRKPGKQISRHAVTKILKYQLWDENNYIQGLLAHQKAKRERKNNNQLARQGNRIRQTHKKAKQDFETMRQVRQEFADVSQYRQKRH